MKGRFVEEIYVEEEEERRRYGGKTAAEEARDSARMLGIVLIAAMIAVGLFIGAMIARVL